MSDLVIVARVRVKKPILVESGWINTKAVAEVVRLCLPSLVEDITCGKAEIELAIVAFESDDSKEPSS